MESGDDTVGGTNGGRRELDALQREAIGWVTRLTSGEATVEDAQQLQAWRGRSRAHEEAFRLASQTWRHAGLLATANVRRPALTRRLVLVGAGTALAAGWVGVSLGLLPGLDQIMSDYATGVGEQASFALPDGSMIYLDGATALDVDLTQDARTAKLVNGAAAFDIAAGAFPFRVAAGPCVISANDADFTLTAGSGPIRIECTRGSLAISGAVTARLNAGERITLAPDYPAEAEPMNPTMAGAWRRGLLVFENRPLSEVVDDINRHRRGRVVLARPGLGARRVDGVFHLQRPDEIVDNLVASLALSETRLPGNIVILI
ncbi:FecR domain-containing protein [Ancylobacter sonchi]|uniref:FecR family protein n=1 Tax=Ancylobacter sonchi TaxID=1937790 RepID=UPI001BD5BB3A|nr:FecR domain-containing protein [Ancylobacter sonchi]MBS7533303.1 FecR domain-containing protein [Ancylobacter sonchi]